MSETIPVQTVTSNAFIFLTDEELHGDRQATEAFLLTFNVDLGFFEARLLGLLRATGARVTVVADATVWDPDTRAVRHAGRSYHFGLCGSRGAFHPKLMVLVGPKRAIATVGSGNLTMGGWQYNHELLTAFTGDAAGMPIAFTDVRNLLSSLVKSEALDPIAAKAAIRTIGRLDALIGTAPPVDTGHRVHASWDGALVDCLPDGPVEELYLSAAFHDSTSSAVRRLLHRLRPSAVHVAVQPGWTHLDPAALEKVLDHYTETTGATCVLVRDPASEGGPEARYRHGKLIEWTTHDGRRHALTGSPNLSHVALMAEVTAGGNHEIAVVGPIVRTLFPGGERISAAEIPTLIADAGAIDAGSATAVARVMSAARTPDGQSLDVRLDRVATAAVLIEVSLHADSPDEWSRVGEVPVGQRAQSLPGVVPAGSRIRSVSEDPETGRYIPTPPVYVSDPQRIFTRTLPGQRTSRAHRAVAADLFGDDIALLDSLQADLATFAKDLAQAKQPTVGRDTLPADDSGAGHTRDGDDAEPWLWLQDQTVRRYGSGLAAWLLALPQLATGSGDGEVPWLDRINEDTEVGLEDEDTETATADVLAAEPEPDVSQVVDHEADPADVKAARCKWAQRAVAAASEVPIDSRMLVLRVTLAFWSAGNWAEGATEPFVLVRDLIRLIGNEAGEQPVEMRERLSALTAVALTVMRQRTNPAIRDEKSNRFWQAAELAAPLLDNLTQEAVSAYTEGLRTGHEGTLLPGHVADTIADLIGGDPLAVLEDQMLEHGYDVERPATNQLLIQGTYPTPEQVALDALGMAEEHDNIAIWAVNDRGDWTLAAWARPDLITVNGGKGKARWRHQRLRVMGPAAVATTLRREGRASLPDVLRPKHQATAAARDVLATLGIEGAEPPTGPSIGRPAAR